MATETKTITLLDYANDREYVVITLNTHVGPSVIEEPWGDPDWKSELEEDPDISSELNGEVDEDGCWSWDGQGRPTDSGGNTFSRITASVDKARWMELSGTEDC